MKISFIGAGNVATGLSVALYEKGADILQIYSRTEKSAALLAGKVCAEPVTDPRKIKKGADVYICALKDDAIKNVLSLANLAGSVIVHTAGSVPMSVLADFTGFFGVLYPMQTFSKNRRIDFSKVYFFLESSNEEVYDMLVDITSLLSQNMVRMSSEKRKYLHLSAVFACNFTNYMYSLSADLVGKSGMEFKALLPLIEETADKVHFLSPDEAQTGPAVRYDLNVINRQKKLLSFDEDKEEIYDLLSKGIHKRY